MLFTTQCHCRKGLIQWIYYYFFSLKSSKDTAKPKSYCLNGSLPVTMLWVYRIFKDFFKCIFIKLLLESSLYSIIKLTRLNSPAHQCSLLPLNLQGICVDLLGMKYVNEVPYLINCKSVSCFDFTFLIFIPIDPERSKTQHFFINHLDESPDFCLWFWKPHWRAFTWALKLFISRCACQAPPHLQCKIRFVCLFWD